MSRTASRSTSFTTQVCSDAQKDRTRYTWPLYAVAARARYECPFIVIAVTPDLGVARWASQPIDLGGGMMFRPHVIGPEGIPQVTDRDLAVREPQLAVANVRRPAPDHGRPQLDDVTSDSSGECAAELEQRPARIIERCTMRPSADQVHV